MMRFAIFLLFVASVSSCKKYLDPKYTYTLQAMEFKANNTNFIMDSCITYIDSMRIDTSKKYSFFTHINGMKDADTVFTIRFFGKSIGNYDIGEYNQMRFKNPDTETRYFAQSGKIVIYEWDNKLKQLSGNFRAQMVDTIGQTQQIESGQFNNAKY